MEATVATTKNNLDRLKEMTLIQFNTPIERCSMKEIKEAAECVLAEDAYFEKEDQGEVDIEAAYYGLLEF